MPLASPYTWNEQVKTIRLRSGAISHTDENSSQLQMVLFRRAAELNMLLTVRPEEERYGLSTGAGGVRTEQAVACTVGDAVFNGPRHRLGVVAACGNIRKADRALQFGRTGGTPQEGDDLGAGAVQVGTEGGVHSALGDLALEHPLHCADIVGVVCHVRKGIHPGEGRLHRDLVGGHLKGVSTIAVVLDGQLLALEIPDDHTIRLVMALRLHGDGHLIALGRAGLGEGNGAVGVFTHLCLDGMGGGTVDGIPVGGRTARRTARVASGCRLLLTCRIK